MARAGWTVMVYLAGDNDLSAAGDRDLDEMRRVGSTSDVHVVAQFDGSGQASTRRLHIERGGGGEAVVELGETDSGEASVLGSFVAWAVKSYPADRYALVLWNHGGGWAPAETADRASTPLGRVLFTSSRKRILSLASPAERAICSDDGSGHSLDTVELGRVLAQVARDLGRPLDLLGLDACLMSCLEVAYEVRQSVEVMVASEEDEPADGWPYAELLGALVAKPDHESRAVAARIVESYVGGYRRRGYEGDVTLAALDLTRLGRLLGGLDDLVSALLLDTTSSSGLVWAAQRRTPHFCRQTQWDLARLAENIAAGAAGPVRRAAEAVAEAMRDRAEGPMIASEQSGPGVAGCGGLSVYLPALVRPSPYYEDLAFARDSRWSGWLTRYREALSRNRP